MHFFNNSIIVFIGICLDCRIKTVHTDRTDIVAFAVFAEVATPENTESFIDTDEGGEVSEAGDIFRLFELHYFRFHTLNQRVKKLPVCRVVSCHNI